MSRVKSILLLIIMIISCEVMLLLTFRVLVVHACLIWAKEFPLVAEFSSISRQLFSKSANELNSATSGNSFAEIRQAWTWKSRKVRSALTSQLIIMIINKSIGLILDIDRKGLPRRSFLANNSLKTASNPLHFVFKYVKFGCFQVSYSWLLMDSCYCPL